MNTLVDEIANAVLYEGYLLYPYRASAVKNRQRWNFGVLYPHGHGDSLMQTEVLVAPEKAAELSIRVRFLHLVAREGSGETWQEAIEREVAIASMDLRRMITNPVERSFAFDSGSDKDGEISRRRETVHGAIEVQTFEDAQSGLFKVRVSIFNRTPADAERMDRNEVLLRSMVSTHTILNVRDGAFVSLLDPPEKARELAASCRNTGTWPVMAGIEGERDTMLSSPIILYDYPQIAPESPGALFDGTEIDEILTLRIMTLTDEEKREMRTVDERAREILERTENMPPDQLMKIHGVLRGLKTP